MVTKLLMSVSWDIPPGKYSFQEALEGNKSTYPLIHVNVHASMLSHLVSTLTDPNRTDWPSFHQAARDTFWDFQSNPFSRSLTKYFFH